MAPDWCDKLLELAIRMQQWYNIIGAYSSRSLSFNSDKLPAIAGIIQKLAELTDYSYVAGLWQEDILTGMLWYRQRSTSKKEPISQALPSWSWARFDGPIGFWQSSSNEPIRVLDKGCEALGISYCTTDKLGIYGQISNAKIKLRGRTIRVQCRYGLDLSYGIYPRVSIHDMNGNEVGIVFMDIDDPNIQSHELLCLLINGYEEHYDRSRLALKSVKGQISTFERVGYVSFNHTFGLEARHYDQSVLLWDSEPRLLYIL